MSKPESPARRQRARADKPAIEPSGAAGSIKRSLVLAKDLLVIKAQIRAIEKEARKAQKSGGSRPDAIQQGRKAAVDTVPMPVRLETEQVRMLKILAALEGTTASAIIRECIADRIEAARAANPRFDAAVKTGAADQ